jgi:hypothetical protein
MKFSARRIFTFFFSISYSLTPCSFSVHIYIVVKDVLHAQNIAEEEEFDFHEVNF